MNSLISLVRNAFTGRSLKRDLFWMGLRAPANVTHFYLCETPEYTARAILAVNTRGE